MLEPDCFASEFTNRSLSTMKLTLTLQIRVYIQREGENDVLKKVSVNNGREYNLPVSKIMAQSPIATPLPFTRSLRQPKTTRTICKVSFQHTKIHCAR